MGSHMFWIGVLFALTFAYILPAWLTGLLFVIALFASNVLPSVAHHAHSSTVAYLIVGVIALVVGLYFGRAYVASGIWAKPNSEHAGEM